MALYGSIPFMLAHTPKRTTGLLFLNSAEMWVDVERTSTGILSGIVGGGSSTATHWIAESGVIDVFVMLGSGPKDVMRQYSQLTGYTEIPPLFSLAYHQVRWSRCTVIELECTLSASQQTIVRLAALRCT
jgi:alpha 1,3-glucosidase